MSSKRVVVGIAVVLLVAVSAVWLSLPSESTHEVGARPMSAGDGTTVVSTDWTARIAATEPAKFPDTMNDALRIPDSSERQRVIAELAVRWLNTDRMTFVAFLEEAEVDAIEGSDVWDRLMPALAQAFPDVDETAAASPVFNDAVQKFIELYADTDPDAALAWVEQWMLGDARDQAAATLVGALAMEDATRAGELLETIKQPYRRVEATTSLAIELADQDPAAAWAWATGRTNSLERTIAVENALGALAENDPGQASRFFNDYRAGIEAEAAQALANLPPESERKSGDARPRGLEDQMSPQQAIEARKRGDLARLSDAAAGIASNWAAGDLAGALAWSQALPEGLLRNEAVNGALAGAADTDPAAAFSAYLGQSAAKSETAAAIFEAWGATDPAGASVRINAIREAPAREAAIEGFVAGWADADSAAASAWATGLPAGAERDAALTQIVAVTADTEPEAAWDYASGIADSARRDASLAEAFGSLLAEDPAAARQRLDVANLSPETRKQLERELAGATQTTR